MFQKITSSFKNQQGGVLDSRVIKINYQKTSKAIAFLFCVIFFVFLPLGFNKAEAATYYVSHSLGSDSYTSTQAQDLATPWKTLTKISSVNFLAGDTILFRRGDIWSVDDGDAGRLLINSTGSAGNVITYGNYGTGDLPKFKGTKLIIPGTSWILDSGNVWVTTVTTQPRIVFMDGVKGTQKSAKASLVAPGDWYWSANNLYIYATTDPDTLYTNPGVETGWKSAAILTNTPQSYITINGIWIWGYNGSGIAASNPSTNWTIQGGTIEYIGNGGSSANGISIVGGNWLVSNNVVRYLEGNGINVFFGSNSVIQNNTITYCWNLLDYGSGGGGDGISLTFTGVSAILAQNNYIQECYQGIDIANAASDNIYYNTVVDSKVNGISLYSGTAGSPCKIYNNTVIQNPDFTSGHGIASQTTAGNGFWVKNNSIYATYTGVNSNVQDITIEKTTLTDVDIDYNLYSLISGGTASIGKFNNTIYANLSDWQVALNATSYSGKDVSAKSANPLFVNSTGGNYNLQSTSPAIDSGTPISGITTDYLGNHIYGTPDIGAYEYQPPYTVGIDNPNISSPIRIYADGKYRYTNTTSGSNVAKLNITPQAGFGTGDYSEWMDVAIDTWHTSTDHYKKWTESSTNHSLVTTNTIGDLKPNAYYALKVDGQEIEKYFANNQGEITFTYSGGYSTKTFEIEERPSSVFFAPTKPSVSSTDPASGTVPSNITQIAISRTPDFNNVSWQPFDKDKFKNISQTTETLYVKFRTDQGAVSDTIIYAAQAANQNTAVTLSDGDIVKTPNNPDVYIIKYKNNKQYKRLILSPLVFKSYGHLKWENIKIIPQEQLDKYTASSLVKETIDSIIYMLFPNGDTGERKSLDTSKPYDADSVYEINRVDRDSYVLTK